MENMYQLQFECTKCNGKKFYYSCKNCEPNPFERIKQLEAENKELRDRVFMLEQAEVMYQEVIEKQNTSKGRVSFKEEIKKDYYTKYETCSENKKQVNNWSLEGAKEELTLEEYRKELKKTGEHVLPIVKRAYEKSGCKPTDKNNQLNSYERIILNGLMEERKNFLKVRRND